MKSTRSKLAYLAKSQVMSDLDVLKSDTFRQYITDSAQNMVIGMGYYLNRVGFSISTYEVEKRAKVRVHPKISGALAYTDGSEIHLNVADEVIRGVNGLENKIKLIYGVVAHEDGHVLFTDFRVKSLWLDKLTQGQWYERPPQGKPADVKLLNGLMGRLEVRPILVSFCNELRNILEDGYVEREMCEAFPGTVKTALQYTNEKMFGSVRDSDLRYDSNTFLNDWANQVLLYTKTGAMKVKSTDEKAKEALEAAKPIVDSAIWERNPAKRYAYSFDLLAIAAGIIIHQLEQFLQQGQQGASMSGNGQPGSNDQQGRNSSENSNSGFSSKGNLQGDSGNGPANSNPKNGDANSSIDGETDSQGNCSDGSSSSGTSVPDVNSIMNALNGRQSTKTACMCEPKLLRRKISETEGNASTNSILFNKKQNAEKAAQEKNRASGREESKKSSDDTTFDSMAQSIRNNAKAEKREVDFERNRLAEMKKGQNVIIQRSITVPSEYKALYDDYAKEVIPVSRRLQKGILQIFRDRKTGGTEHNLIIGNRFEANKVSNRSGYYFARQKLPTESPKLRVDVLIDESGSTSSGNLYVYATKAAIAMDDFCTALEIEHRILGYTGDYQTATIHSYCEPEKISNKDKYRLVGIQPGGNTPTGQAVHYALSCMEKSNEEHKLLLVISDGGSNDRVVSKEKMQQEIKNAKRKGITVLAAGIGSQRKAVEKDFGTDNFVDISDLDGFPGKLCKLIRRMLL